MKSPEGRNSYKQAKAAHRFLENMGGFSRFVKTRSPLSKSEGATNKFF